MCETCNSFISVHHSYMYIYKYRRSISPRLASLDMKLHVMGRQEKRNASIP